MRSYIYGSIRKSSIPAAARSRHGFRSWRARALLAGERRAALNAAVDALAEPDREILLRRYYFGQKPREIAAALGLDKKQVDNRLYQTKRRLRASVTGAEGE